MKYEKKSWWTQRTSLEKTLLLVVSLTTVVSISLLVSLIIVAIKKNPEVTSEGTTILTTTDDVSTTPSGFETTLSVSTETTSSSSTIGDNDICLTQACVQTTLTILSKIDETVEPCDDFYQFTCGKFLSETVIPENKASIDFLNVVEEELKIQLRNILDEPVMGEEIIPLQNVRKLYNSCMNTTQADSLGDQPLLNALLQLGGWPVIGQEWSSSSWTWQEFFVNSRKGGFTISSLFTLEVDIDFKNTTKRTIVIDQPQLGLDREFLILGIENPLVEAYHKYQVDLVISLGSSRVNAEIQMQDVLNFEISLAQISKANEDRKDPMNDYNSMTINELQTKYNYIDWQKYLNDILPEEIQLQSSDTFVNFNVDFFEKLEALLDDKNVIANYLMWRVAISSVDYLSDSLKNLQHEFNKVLTGTEARVPSWKECVDVVLDNYPHALGALYVQKHFSGESKAMMLEMFDNIKNEFRENLKTIEWMDQETKESTLIKLEVMKAEIGFADEILDEEKLQEFYTNFPDVNEDQYFETIHSLKAASADVSFKRLNEPIIEKEWFDKLPPAIVNAFYSSIENSIWLPAGILQGSFFSANRPNYMNYGAIGLVIGHEITHGFDDQGSQFDAEGNLRDWWSPETRQEFLERTQCFKNQYSSYIEPSTGRNLNGINTLSENIADNGGIKYAYRSYIKWVEENGSESKLPDLSYSPNQLFWISFGQMLCSIYRDAEMLNVVTTDIHAPPQFRVFGSLQNSREFSEDFNCQRESNMNPTEKCEIW